jgi:hypothetical protein
MAQARYCRMVLVGAYTSGPFSGEIWQTGISFVGSEAPSNFGESIREPLPRFTVEQEGNFDDGTTYQVDWAWQGVTKFAKPELTSIADLGVAFFSGLKALVPAASRLEEIRLAAYKDDGKMINGNNVFRLKAPVAGTGNNASGLPAQCCVVGSLQTGARGPGGRGRMYLPLTGITTAAGLLSTTNRTTVLTQLATLVNAINDNTTAAAIVNRARMEFSTITSVAVGDEIDIQRRRSNRIDENYVTQSTNWP